MRFITRSEPPSGTVDISAVDMFGKSGRAIPVNDHTLDITLCGISTKPGVVDGHIAEYLCVTLSVDLTIIDDAPAERFAMQLKELIE